MENEVALLAETVRQKDEEILRNIEMIAEMQRQNEILSDRVAALELHSEEREAERRGLVSDHDEVVALRERCREIRETASAAATEHAAVQMALANTEARVRELEAGASGQARADARIAELETQVTELLTARQELVAYVAESGRQFEMAKAERDQALSRLEEAQADLLAHKNQLDLERENAFSRDATARQRQRLGNPGPL